jgi:hypothetical protein
VKGDQTARLSKPVEQYRDIAVPEKNFRIAADLYIQVRQELNGPESPPRAEDCVNIPALEEIQQILRASLGCSGEISITGK